MHKHGTGDIRAVIRVGAVKLSSTEDQSGALYLVLRPSLAWSYSVIIIEILP